MEEYLVTLKTLALSSTNLANALIRSTPLRLNIRSTCHGNLVCGFVDVLTILNVGKVKSHRNQKGSVSGAQEFFTAN